MQDNQSYSTMGVVRAIHYQRGKFAQAKLVRVLSGRVCDVAVDLREDSPTFGHHLAVELSSENKKQLFIPRGFGHGFSVLSETAEFLNIDWQLPNHEIKVSQKDLELPTLEFAQL